VGTSGKRRSELQFKQRTQGLYATSNRVFIVNFDLKETETASSGKGKLRHEPRRINACALYNSTARNLKRQLYHWDFEVGAVGHLGNSSRPGDALLRLEELDGAQGLRIPRRNPFKGSVRKQGSTRQRSIEVERERLKNVTDERNCAAGSEPDQQEGPEIRGNHCTVRAEIH